MTATDPTRALVFMGGRCVHGFTASQRPACACHQKADNDGRES